MTDNFDSLQKEESSKSDDNPQHESANKMIEKILQIVALEKPENTYPTNGGPIDENDSKYGGFVVYQALKNHKLKKDDQQKIEDARKFIDDVIEAIDEEINTKISNVMQDSDFKELEASWRGLYLLVDRTDFNKDITVEILNCTKEELEKDFKDATEPVLSGFYKQIYTNGFDQPGAVPFACIMGNFEFDSSSKDIALIDNISKIAAASHCPFISTVDKDFFQKKDIAALPDPQATKNMLNTQMPFKKWNNFRNSPDSKYVGLTLNKFLLRLPYADKPVKKDGSYTFIETIGSEAKMKNYLWGNPAFAFMANVHRSFAKSGWAFNIRGPKSGGKVEDLPFAKFDSVAKHWPQFRMPLQNFISETMERTLSECGFMPMSVYKNEDYAVFFAAHSARQPALGDDSPEGKAATASAKLTATLPNIFLLSRFAHMIKVIIREEIGASKEKEDVLQDVNRLINQYVTKMEKPGDEQKAKYPLRQAFVEVSENEDAPGYYNFDFKIRPHFQLEGVSVNLTLVSKINN
ncbi:MAG: type VI secretion system contractile sheath large subunit [Desulfamplus sp.]|nr:type VI secretion system contractile sheath large subunit [Desulfamplus sp.]